MIPEHSPRALKNPMHAGVARVFKVKRLSDFEAGVLAKGYVTREEYEEAYRRYVARMTAAGFTVDEVVDGNGYFVRNHSSSRRDELFTRGDPAAEVARLDREERSLSQACEAGTFQLIGPIFREQANPTGQYLD